MKFAILIVLAIVTSAHAQADTSRLFLNCSNKGKSADEPRIDVSARFVSQQKLANVESFVYYGQGVLTQEKFNELSSITPEARNFSAPGSVVFDIGSVNAWGNSELNIPTAIFAQATGAKTKKIKFSAPLVDWTVDGDYYGEFKYDLDCVLTYEVHGQ